MRGALVGLVVASDDLAGVELAGAFENVVVAAASIATGAGLAPSTCAFVLATALAEVTELAVALGASLRSAGR